MPEYSEPITSPVLIRIGVCVKLCSRTTILSALVRFGNPTDTICMSASSPLFVPVTEMTKVCPSIMTGVDRLTFVITASGLLGSIDWYICGKT